MNIIGIIPARYASTRYPGKPLVAIEGKTMIQRVFEQASKSTKLSEVWIATDDERIWNHVKTFTERVVLTSPSHINGTERCYEAFNLCKSQATHLINIQGDEPFINPEQIDQVASIFDENKDVQIATLIKKIHEQKVLENPGVVKVVINNFNKALYFSRAIIPFVRNADREKWLAQTDFYKHIGIYGFNTNVLEKLVQLPMSRNEESESLEQLRWLDHGYEIYCGQTLLESKSIDTPEDLSLVLNQLRGI